MPKFFERYLKWEQLSNVTPYRQTTRLFDLDLIPVPIEKVSIDFSSDFSKEHREIFNPASSPYVYFPVHPLASKNLAATYPHRSMLNEEEKSLVKKGQVHFTASRSLYFYPEQDREQDRQGDHKDQKIPRPAFQLKLPTDYVYNPDEPSSFSPFLHHQWDKADLSRESVSVRARENYISGIDKKIGKDPELEILRDVGAVRLGFDARKPKNGFVIRDISPLMDGHAYLPGFSLPFEGAKIASQLQEDPVKLWGEAYAKALGRAKAKLLLRYGLQMVSPNAQNWLLQLDPQTLRPTGKIILRDLGDSHFVGPVIKGLEKNSYWFAYEKYLGEKIDNYIHPYWTNSAWKLDEEGDPPITQEILREWGILHAEAYLEEINRSLGTSIRPLIEGEKGYYAGPSLHFDMINIHQQRMRLLGNELDMDEMKYLYPIQKFLQSEEGERKLGEYRENLVRQHSHSSEQQQGGCDLAQAYPDQLK